MKPQRRCWQRQERTAAHAHRDAQLRRANKDRQPTPPGHNTTQHNTTHNTTTQHKLCTHRGWRGCKVVTPTVNVVFLHIGRRHKARGQRGIGTRCDTATGGLRRCPGRGGRGGQNNGGGGRSVSHAARGVQPGTTHNTNKTKNTATTRQHANASQVRSGRVRSGQVRSHHVRNARMGREAAGNTFSQNQTRGTKRGTQTTQHKTTTRQQQSTRQSV